MLSALKYKYLVAGLLLLLLLMKPSLAAALSVTTTSLPAASRQVYYSESLDASGGDGSYRWSLDSGRLPPGLNLYREGVIEGIPTSTGYYSFTVRVRDDAGDSTTKALNLRVLTETGPVITTGTLPLAQLGTGYSSALAASHGQAPYSWSLQSGSLPPGLSLSTDGVISGTPTAAGSHAFTVSVRDDRGRTSHQSFTLTVESLFITTAELPAAARLGLYREKLFVAGGTGEYRWSLSSGRLPPGLTLLREGVLTGVPTSSGTYSFTVRVRDNSNRSVTKNLSILVADRGTINILKEELPRLHLDSSTLIHLEAEGGTPPYNWSILVGALPRGMTLHNNGVISGTPRAEGDFTFTVQVEDKSGLFREKAYLLKVRKPAALQDPPAPAPASRGEEISVYINGQQLQLDTQPVLQEGRTLVPLRGVFEQLKAAVSWDNLLRQAVIKRHDLEIVLRPGKKEALLNGLAVNLSVAPYISNGRVMVPLRFVGEALGVEVHWDGKQEIVQIWD